MNFIEQSLVLMKYDILQYSISKLFSSEKSSKLKISIKL